MATAKPRYEQQTGEFVKDIQFDESQVAMLRSIKDDPAFIDDITHIATLYGCLCRSEPDELSAGEITATLRNLEQNAITLAGNLENLPQEVDMALWSLSYRRDFHPGYGKSKVLAEYAY